MGAPSFLPNLSALYPKNARKHRAEKAWRANDNNFHLLPSYQKNGGLIVIYAPLTSRVTGEKGRKIGQNHHLAPSLLGKVYENFERADFLLQIEDKQDIIYL